MARLTILFFIFVAGSFVRARPDGPPIASAEQRTAVCTNLIPTASSPHKLYIGHNHYQVHTDLQLLTSVNMYRYFAGRQYSVRIMGNTFRGFLMQALNPSGEVIGTFTPLDPTTQQLLDCTAANVPANATITHNNPSRGNLTPQNFIWNSPADSGYVVFRYTLVSQLDQYFGPLTAPPPPPAHPTRAISEYPLTRRYPEGCQPSDNCDVFFGIAVNSANSDFLDVYVEGKAAWVAAGFAPERSMFGADAVVCVQDPVSSMVTGLDAFNSRLEDSPRQSNEIDIEQNTVFFSGSSENGIIKCRISKPIIGNCVPQQDRNLNEEHWLIYARGNNFGSGKNDALLSVHNPDNSSRLATAPRVTPSLAARSPAVAALLTEATEVTSTMSSNTAVTTKSGTVPLSASIISSIVSIITLFTQL